MFCSEFPDVNKPTQSSAGTCDGTAYSPPRCVNCQSGWIGSSCALRCIHGTEIPPFSEVCVCSSSCYTGDTCDVECSNRGKCTNGTCVCDEGSWWTADHLLSFVSVHAKPILAFHVHVGFCCKGSFPTLAAKPRRNLPYDPHAGMCETLLTKEVSVEASSLFFRPKCWSISRQYVISANTRENPGSTAN